MPTNRIYDLDPEWGAAEKTVSVRKVGETDETAASA